MIRKAGAIDPYANFITRDLMLPSVLSLLVPSLIITVSASAVNNWPMTMLGLLSIEQASALSGLSADVASSLIFSNIIGNNLSPTSFPLAR